MFEVNIAIGAIIVAIVNIATTNFHMPKRFSPIVAVILGILGGLVYVYPESIKDAVLYGLMEGLGAVGFYSASKNTIQGFVPSKKEETIEQ